MLERLYPKYEFDNFVVGDCNEHAYKIANYIVDCSDEEIIPIYIFSNHGCGKSHLLQAIANRYKELHPDENVIYMTGDEFVIEFITALRNLQLRQFEEKYRNADFLLLDNVQALGKKEIMQETLASIIEILDAKDKRFVLSANAPGHLIGLIDGRLISFVAEAVSIEITAPDYETKVKILEGQLDQLNIEKTVETSRIIAFIAETIKDDNRELIGALKRVTTLAEILEKPPTLEFAKEVLKDKITENDRL